MCHFDHDDCIWKFPISRFSRIYIGNWRPTLFGLRTVTFPKYASATKSPVCQYFQLSLQACPVLFQSFLLLKRNWKLCMHPKRRSLTPRVFPFFVEISEGKYFLSACSNLSIHWVPFRWAWLLKGFLSRTTNCFFPWETLSCFKPNLEHSFFQARLPSL